MATRFDEEAKIRTGLEPSLRTGRWVVQGEVGFIRDSRPRQAVRGGCAEKAAPANGHLCASGGPSQRQPGHRSQSISRICRLHTSER